MKLGWVLILVLLFVSGSLVNVAENIISLAKGEKTENEAVTSIAVGFATGLHCWMETGYTAWSEFKADGGLYSLAIVGLAIAILLVALRTFYRIVYDLRDLFRRQTQVSATRDKITCFLIAFALLMFFTIGVSLIIG